jgi:chorismate dehydratase
MGRPRISAISYLNTAPLMWDFEHEAVGAEFEISYTIPSDCANALRAGSADIGIIPVAAYTTVPGLMILPGVAIAARRAVRSILLVCKMPLEKVRTVALDNSSLTSVALTRVIFDKWLGGGRVFQSMEPDLDQMLREHDAGLLIGDPALQVDRSRFHTYDLAEEWIRLTGKPFVFAFWAIRKAALPAVPAHLDLANVFQESRNHGLGHLDEIARPWAKRLKLSDTDVRNYLQENIHYYLDAECLDGMQLFYRYAAECGALPPAPALEFCEASRVGKE